MSAPPVLWHIEISHFNEKVRWALDYKGVPHVREAVLPGTQQFRAFRQARAQTTPILDLDGKGIADSTRIIEEIERRWPEPALYPSDPEERRRALEIEDFFDEHVAHDLRRVVFFDLMTEPDTFLFTLYGENHPRIRLLKRLSPVLRPIVKARYRINHRKVEESRAKVRAGFDRIESELGPGGYLVGDSFSVADLTAAAIMTPLVMPPQFPYIKLPPERRPPAAREFRDSLKDRPGFKWVLDMYERHRGASAEVAA